MNRRQFLKTMMAAAATAATPVPISAAKAFLREETNTIISDDWIIDYETKTIEYIGPDDSSCTMMQLYKFLKEEWPEAKGGEEIPISIQRDKGVEFMREPEWSEFFENGNLI